MNHSLLMVAAPMHSVRLAAMSSSRSVLLFGKQALLQKDDIGGDRLVQS